MENNLEKSGYFETVGGIGNDMEKSRQFWDHPESGKWSGEIQINYQVFLLYAQNFPGSKAYDELSKSCWHLVRGLLISLIGNPGGLHWWLVLSQDVEANIRSKLCKDRGARVCSRLMPYSIVGKFEWDRENSLRTSYNSYKIRHTHQFSFRYLRQILPLPPFPNARSWHCARSNKFSARKWECCPSMHVWSLYWLSSTIYWLAIKKVVWITTNSTDWSII